MVIDALQLQRLFGTVFNYKGFKVQPYAVAAADLLLKIRFRKGSGYKKRIPLHPVTSFCIFRPSAIVEAAVRVDICLGIGIQRYIERITGKFELMGGILHQFIPITNAVFIPYTLQVIGAAPLEIWVKLAGNKKEQ